MKTFKWEVRFNNQSIGKYFFTKAECKKEWNKLWNANLYGYTIVKMNNLYNYDVD